MEHASSSSPSVAPPPAGTTPHVLVPISHPDSPVPTYAVLQFLGFSSASSPPSLPSPLSPLNAPAIASSPQSFIITSTQNYQVPALQVVCAAPPSNPSHGLKGGGSPADSNSCSSEREKVKEKEREKEKKLVSVKPSSMKKQGACNGGAIGKKGSNTSCNSRHVSSSSSSSSAPSSPSSSPGTTFAPPAPLPPSRVTVSQTERETIIHTHCSNFREVVHQLTGASSNDKDLLPVTMPTRMMQARSDTCSSMKADTTAAALPRSSDLAPRRPSTKLLERRKSSKMLERLSTLAEPSASPSSLSLSICRDLPPLVPSPVTPLASDFDKISLPHTSPLGISGTSCVIPVSVLSPSFSSHDTNMTEADHAGHFHTKHEICEEDHASSEKTFFLQSRVPRNSAGPTLLPLFPESPRE